MRALYLWIGLVTAAACGDNVVVPTGDLTVTFEAGPAEATNQVTAEFRFSAPAAVRFTCALDDGPAAACSSPHAVTTDHGTHALTVTAYDELDHAGTPGAYPWRVDTVAPDTVITVAPSAVETTTTASFTFATAPAESDATFECAVDAAGFAPCTSPASVTRGDGVHTFRVRATDAVGNVDPTPAEHTWTIDTIGPPLTLLQAPADPSNVTAPVFTFSSSDAAATFQCQIDGVAPFAACTSPYTAPALADGAHTFRLRATDAAQNQTALSYTWTVDTVPPTVAITAGPSGATSTAAPTFQFTVSADAAVIECALDGGAFAPCTSPLTTSTLAEGAHELVVRAADAAGNVATASRAFTVDTIAPTVAIVSGPSGVTNLATPTWTFTTTDAPTVIECALGAAPAVPCTGSFTPAAALADGPHTFTVRVADAAGNEGTDARMIVVDTAPPVITITSGPTGTILDPTPTFTFTIAGGFTVSRCRIIPGAFVPCAGTFTPAPLGGGPHTFEVEADDEAGNTGRATRTFEVDTDAPTVAITAAPGSPTNDPTPAFEFVVGGTAATVECRIDGGAFAPCTSPVAIAPPLAEGSHTFEVRACTAVPSCASDTRTFTVDLTPPTLAINTGPQDPAPTAQPQPAFTFTAVGATTVRCRITSAAAPDPAFVPCTSSFAPSGPLADGAHVFEVVAEDEAGNTTTRTRAFTVDTTAPVIAFAPPVPPRTSDPRPLALFTTTDASSVTTTCAVDGGTALPCDGAVGFRAPANLSEGPHAYHVIATDAAGNQGFAQVSFLVDLTPPAVTITGGPDDPTNDDTPTFTFTTSADTTRARCELDTGEVIDPCTTGVTFPPISPGARTFTVTAFDDAVPANTASATLSFFLGFCGDDVVQGTEVCDGDVGAETCESLGEAPGTLACNATCDGYDVSGCDGGFVAIPGADDGALPADARICRYGGLTYRSTNAYLGICTENHGVWKLPLIAGSAIPAADLSFIGMVAADNNNPAGRSIQNAQANGGLAYVSDSTSSTPPFNAFRANNFDAAPPQNWFTRALMGAAGQTTNLYNTIQGSGMSGFMFAGHSSTLGAITFNTTIASTAAPTQISPTATGAATALATRSSIDNNFPNGQSDIFVAVYGKAPDASGELTIDVPGGGGIFWTCNRRYSGMGGGLMVQLDFLDRSNGLGVGPGSSPDDRDRVWSLTVDRFRPQSPDLPCVIPGDPTAFPNVIGSAFYAALRGGGRVYRIEYTYPTSGDPFLTWVPFHTGIPEGAEVYQIAVDCQGTPTACADDVLLFAATSVGLYTRIPDGPNATAWTLAGLGGQEVRSVVTEPAHPQGVRPKVFVGVAAPDGAPKIYGAGLP